MNGEGDEGQEQMVTITDRLSKKSRYYASPLSFRLFFAKSVHSIAFDRVFEKSNCN